MHRSQRQPFAHARGEARFDARPRSGRGLSAALAAVAIASILTGLGVATGQRAASAPLEANASTARPAARDSSPRAATRVDGVATNRSDRVASKRPNWMGAWPLGLGDMQRSAWNSRAEDGESRSGPSEPRPWSDRAGAVASDADPNGPEVRIFDGRPIRAVRMLVMRVTAYSPDAESCGDSADGITASGYPVETNGGHLVAADPSLLPLGSLVSVPGYDGGDVVPVLDVGGAIKGNRLDVLFPTHERARRWGVQELEVTVWEYADGKPSGFRRMRQPKRPS